MPIHSASTDVCGGSLGAGGDVPIDGPCCSSDAPNYWFEPDFPANAKQFILDHRWPDEETLCCHDEARLWVEKLTAAGFPAREVSGCFGRDLEGHGWVEIEGRIFDPTAAQFLDYQDPQLRQAPQRALYTPQWLVWPTGWEAPYKAA